MLIPNVSIILPSARNPQRVQDIIRAFTTGNSDVNVRVIVCAPADFKVVGAYHFIDTMQGPAIATAQAYSEAIKFDCDYVAWWSDECMPQENCLRNMINFIDGYKEPFIGEFRRIERENDWHKVDHHMIYEVCGYQYARWGMMSVKSVELCGGFFDPEFHAHWGDVDLGLRCWLSGGKVATCIDAMVSVQDQPDTLHAGNWNRYFEKDLAYMRSKWQLKYPIMERSWESWNCGQQLSLV